MPLVRKLPVGVLQGDQVDLLALVEEEQQRLGHGRGLGGFVVAGVGKHQASTELVSFPVMGWSTTPVHQVHVTYSLENKNVCLTSTACGKKTYTSCMQNLHAAGVGLFTLQIYEMFVAILVCKPYLNIYCLTGDKRTNYKTTLSSSPFLTIAQTAGRSL